MQRCPDITLISSTYGWEPVVSVRQGLAKMIPAVRTELSL